MLLAFVFSKSLRFVFEIFIFQKGDGDWSVPSGRLGVSGVVGFAAVAVTVVAQKII